MEKPGTVCSLVGGPGSFSSSWLSQGRGSGLVTCVVGMLFFKWVLTFPPVLAGTGIKAAEALIWVVQLSFVKGNLIRRAGIERHKLCFPALGSGFPWGIPESSEWQGSSKYPKIWETWLPCHQRIVQPARCFWTRRVIWGYFSEPRNVSGFRKVVRKNMFSVFMWIHKSHQSRAVLQEHKIQIQQSDCKGFVYYQSAPRLRNNSVSRAFIKAWK